MIEFSIWDIFRNLLLAARWTIVLSLVAFIGGGIVGALLLVGRLSATRAVPGAQKAARIARRALDGYVLLFQGTPLLMQLFLAYFGLALFGINVPAWVAAAVALTLYTSAYLAEIWRGCVDAIPKGQWEAAQSLALNFGEQLRYIVLPQAVRIAVPPTVGFLVQVVKGTALASVIGFIELTKAGTMITNATFKPFVVYSCVALMYFALCFPVSLYARKLERKARNGRC
jgi:polar amino acid transport system permease protein